jgi:hypothetical protein
MRAEERVVVSDPGQPAGPARLTTRATTDLYPFFGTQPPAVSPADGGRLIVCMRWKWDSNPHIR